jgi:hypothetical protein
MLQSHPAIKRYRNLASTPEYQIFHADYQPPFLSFPKKKARTWPNLVDFRAVGWFSHAQWTVPTELDRWLPVMDLHEKMAVQRVEADVWRLVFYTKEQSRIRIYYVDKKLKKVLAYFECPSAPANDPATVTCAKSCICKTLLEYSDKGQLIRVRMGGFGQSWRLDVLDLQEGKEIDEEYFLPRSFAKPNVPIEIDSPVLESLDLMNQLGLTRKIEP